MDVRLIVKTNNAVMHGRTKNLAEGGMGATIAGDIPLNDIVELELQLPRSSHVLVMRATVRFRQGFQYGFRFHSITSEQLKMIRDELGNLPPEP